MLEEADRRTRTTEAPEQPGNRTWRMLSAVLAGCAALLGAFLLYRTLARYELSEIAASIASASPVRLASAFAFAAASYFCLTGFDWLALRYAGRPLAYRRAALASFTGLSLGHNIGFAALSTGAIRYRFYSRWGLTAFEVGKVVVFCGVTVGLGLATVAGLAMLLQPALAGPIIGLPAVGAMGLGAACLAMPTAYVAASAMSLGRLRFRRWSLELPTPGVAAFQVLLGGLNFALVAACLHQALSAISDVSYPAVATVYVIANTATLVSHVPGGLGVIESTVLYLLPDGGTIAAVLLFRFVYFLVPLCFGLTAFFLSELLLKRNDREDGSAEPS